MGYDKVFTDEFFGWSTMDDEGDDDYLPSEKNRHKQEWDE